MMQWETVSIDVLNEYRRNFTTTGQGLDFGMEELIKNEKSLMPNDTEMGYQQAAVMHDTGTIMRKTLFENAGKSDRELTDRLQSRHDQDRAAMDEWSNSPECCTFRPNAESLHQGVKTLDGSMTLLQHSSVLELKSAGIVPLFGFNYLSDKFPSSHMKYIVNKNGNRYEETDVSQYMGTEDLLFITNLLQQNGMEVVEFDVVLELLAAANVEEDHAYL